MHFKHAVSGLLIGSALLMATSARPSLAQVSQVPVLIPGASVEGIDFEPIPAIYVVAPRGTVKEASIVIINRNREPLAITGIENSSRRFTARTQTLEPGRRYRLVVTVKGEGPAGDQVDVIQLKTNLEKNPVLRIPVNTRVRERVYTFPQSVFLGRFDIGQIQGNPKAAREAGQTLMVYRKGIPGFRIKLASDVPFLRFTSELGPKGDQWESSVWIDPEQAKAGEIKGSIFIETNDPEVPRLVVPVTGRLLPAEPMTSILGARKPDVP
jgi:hypothetical protein